MDRPAGLSPASLRRPKVVLEKHDTGLTATHGEFTIYMMDKLRRIKWLRPLLPGEDDISPRSMGLAGLWMVILCLVGFYAVMLPFAGILGMTPWEFAPIYVTESLSALDPILVMLIGNWVLYWYWYSVALPVAMYFDRRQALAYALLYALDSFLNGLCRVVVPRCRDLVTVALGLSADLTNGPLRTSSRRGLPRHLATGWRPGSHLHVVYH